MENYALTYLLIRDPFDKYLSGNIPIAICSGSLQEDILPIIGKLGVSDLFETIVTAEDTPRSNPDPASYRLTAERLGITQGVVIEATRARLQAAKAPQAEIKAGQRPESVFPNTLGNGRACPGKTSASPSEPWRVSNDWRKSAELSD